MSHVQERNPLAVATQRLLEKQGNVREQLSAVERHLDGLGTLERELDNGLEKAVELVELGFSNLKESLDLKKKELTDTLREGVAVQKSNLDEYKVKSQEAITKAKEVNRQRHR